MTATNKKKEERRPLTIEVRRQDDCPFWDSDLCRCNVDNKIECPLKVDHEDLVSEVNVHPNDCPGLAHRTITCRFVGEQMDAVAEELAKWRVKPTRPAEGSQGG